MLAPGEELKLDALVIGAGFAGLYQLLCLRDRLGLSVKAPEAGGGRAARGLDHRLHQHLCGKGLERIEARPEAVDEWVAEINETARKTVLPMAKRSWYLGRTFPESRACSCLTRAVWCGIGSLRRCSGTRLRARSKRSSVCSTGRRPPDITNPMSQSLP